MNLPSNHVTQLFDSIIANTIGVGHKKKKKEEKEKKTGPISKSLSKRMALKGLCVLCAAIAIIRQQEWVRPQEQGIIPYFLSLHAVFWHLQLQLPTQKYYISFCIHDVDILSFLQPLYIVVSIAFRWCKTERCSSDAKGNPCLDSWSELCSPGRAGTADCLQLKLSRLSLAPQQIMDDYWAPAFLAPWALLKRTWLSAGTAIFTSKYLQCSLALPFAPSTFVPRHHSPSCKSKSNRKDWAVQKQTNQMDHFLVWLRSLQRAKLIPPADWWSPGIKLQQCLWEI